MLTKGRKWSTRVLNSPISPAEVWHCFKIQALPAVKYGLVALMASFREVDETCITWYYSFLPALGVNQNISREWRTLPIKYQGLGLPQMSLEKLAVSLQNIQRHWGSPSTVGQVLRSVYELVQLEVGLSGNFLLRDYNVHGCLASCSWFQLLWEYMSFYGVVMELEDVTVPPIRKRDCVLMEDAVRVLPACQWESFNRARKYFKIYYGSQLVLCDGSTVDPVKILATQQPGSQMRFPKEEPTCADILLWRDTICLLTSPTL
jgi:hypothetical protein